MSSESSALCLDCGLCCDGTLFANAELDDHELSTARSVGLPILQRGPDRHFIPIPCQCHGTAGCSIYERRPSVCRDYKCELLKAVEQGTVTAEKARRIVEDAKGLQRDIYRHLGGREPGRSIWRQFDDHVAKGNEIDDIDFRMRHADLLLRAGTLVMLLERHFRHPDPNAKSRHGAAGPQTLPGR